MARYFYALDLCSADRQALVAIQHSLMPTLAKSVTASAKQYKVPRLTKPENLHLTLTFIGQASQAQLSAINKAARHIANIVANETQPSFQLIADHLAVFPNAKVLYVGLAHTPQWLQYLEQALTKTAENNDVKLVERAFTPHITLSRKVSFLPCEIGLTLSSPLTLNITSFSLYRSDSTPNGVCYQAIERFSLT
ncbi:RNA 2',3'-cyclic phosphodiesterase [Thalassotalea euphylliae]|uniref:RNA 2',3'-cyclic phosphodiesterase n=1 Tax=Thalassotalea euphylliae TaxID=1655234 RepID=A0A3E0U4E2_9GAMM|nr:RNA 2',3'-cyclic phosphodiesterase [Thalassotalea euphylliae]REL31659.1 RNA 2',3'-cyclic phosphodiesterase [Thalassotalea euphylliae]